MYISCYTLHQQSVRRQVDRFVISGLFGVEWGQAESAGKAANEASRRSVGQSMAGLPGRIPGRSLGTRTRNARGLVTHRTGVAIMTVSPSIPTGTSAASASTTTSPAVKVVTP